jgi:hypothetical protein
MNQRMLAAPDETRLIWNLDGHLEDAPYNHTSHLQLIPSSPSRAVTRTSYLLTWIHYHRYLILSIKSLHPSKSLHSAKPMLHPSWSLQSAPLSLHPSKSLQSAPLKLNPSKSLQSAPLLLHPSWSLQSAPLLLHPSWSLA